MNTFTRFGTTQQIAFFKRTSLYLRSGIPISRALEHMIEDSASQSTRRLLTKLSESVGSGLPLSKALEQYPKHFAAYTIGFIHMGESSGNLSVTLDQLSTTLRQQASLRSKILSALIYPALTFCGTIAVVLFLTMVIFPKIVPVLRGLHTALPFPTRVLIAASTLFAKHWFAIIMCVISFLVISALSLKMKRVRRLCEHTLLRVPLLSLFHRNYQLATFARTLSVQLKSGVRIVVALELTRVALAGLLYPETVSELEKLVAGGQRLSEAMRNYKNLFPSLISQMVAVGESTGTLSTNLESLANEYEDTLDELSKNLTVLIEPVLMIFMGLIVGFVAMAIISPIYQVTQNLNVS